MNALLEAYNLVQARFLRDGRDVQFAFGWLPVNEHFAGQRVVWQPGDDSSNAGDTDYEFTVSNDGSIDSPPVLARQWLLVSLFISAYPSENRPEDESAQVDETLQLRRAVFNALTKELGTPNWKITSERWVTDVSRRSQQCIRMIIAVCDWILDDAPDAKDVTRPADIHLTVQGQPAD